jgi:hypothetical protein
LLDLLEPNSRLKRRLTVYEDHRSRNGARYPSSLKKTCNLTALTLQAGDGPELDRTELATRDDLGNGVDSDVSEVIRLESLDEDLR